MDIENIKKKLAELQEEFTAMEEEYTTLVKQKDNLVSANRAMLEKQKELTKELEDLKLFKARMLGIVGSVKNEVDKVEITG